MTPGKPTRRAAIKGGLAIAAVPVAPFAQQAAAQDRPVTKVLDFTTSADISKAEAEGEYGEQIDERRHEHDHDRPLEEPAHHIA